MHIFQGFEARGTEIGQKLTAWKNLLDESGSSGLLSHNPKELIIPGAVDKARIRAQNRRRNGTGKGGRKKNKVKLEEKIINIHFNKIHFEEDDKLVEEVANATEYNFTGSWEYGKNLSYLTDEKNENIVQNKEKWSNLRQSKPPTQKINTHNGFFCDSPRKFLILSLKELSLTTVYNRFRY